MNPFTPTRFNPHPCMMAHVIAVGDSADNPPEVRPRAFLCRAPTLKLAIIDPRCEEITHTRGLRWALMWGDTREPPPAVDRTVRLFSPPFPLTRDGMLYAAFGLPNVIREVTDELVLDLAAAGGAFPFHTWRGPEAMENVDEI